MPHITPTASWSSEVTNANSGVLECIEGAVRINATGSTPEDTADGFLMATGDKFVPPAGVTFKHIKASDSAELVWQPFPA